MLEIGDVIKVYNGEHFGKRLEKAMVVDIRYNVKASFDNNKVYPVIFDVYLFDSHVMSKGHILPYFDLDDNAIFEA